MARRKVRDHEEAAELLDALDVSGLTLSEFCRQRGVDGRSLHCWQRNTDRRGGPSSSQGLRLMELTVARPAPVASYRVLVNGLAIEVDDHFRQDTLARLIEVAAAC